MVNPNASDDFALSPRQDLVLRDLDGDERLRLEAEPGALKIKNAEGKIITTLGAIAAPGSPLPFPTNSEVPTENSGLYLYPDNTSSEEATVALDARTGNASFAGAIQVGGIASFVREIRVEDNASFSRAIQVGGVASFIREIRVGGAGIPGGIIVRDTDGATAISLDGETGDAIFGRGDLEGESRLVIKDRSGRDLIILSARDNRVSLGNGGSCSFYLTDLDGQNNAIALSFESLDSDVVAAKITAGCPGTRGRIAATNSQGQETIRLDGQSGQVILPNADCAEEFDVVEATLLEPGTVMVIAAGDRLQQSCISYDKRVAGVLSGAGKYKPGIVLDKKQTSHGRMPVALMGKVYCKVDADYAPIEIGDLLTTSSTPGHAMKASDPLKAFGAVIGKALQPCKTGQDMIPILIALQ